MIDNTIKISEHGEERISERAGENYCFTDEEIDTMTAVAVWHGLNHSGVLNRRYKQYLYGLLKKYKYTCSFKIYGGYTFVFDAFTSTLITMYPVPDYAVNEKRYGDFGDWL